MRCMRGGKRCSHLYNMRTSMPLLRIWPIDFFSDAKPKSPEVLTSRPTPLSVCEPCQLPKGSGNEMSVETYIRWMQRSRENKRTTQKGMGGTREEREKRDGYGDWEEVCEQLCEDGRSQSSFLLRSSKNLCTPSCRPWSD